MYARPDPSNTAAFTGPSRTEVVETGLSAARAVTGTIAARRSVPSSSLRDACRGRVAMGATLTQAGGSAPHNSRKRARIEHPPGRFAAGHHLPAPSRHQGIARGGAEDEPLVRPQPAPGREVGDLQVMGG